jgi:lipopolysaccharide transport system permease protein
MTMTVDAAEPQIPEPPMAQSAIESLTADLPEVVYTPDSALRRPSDMLRDMFRDLGKSRELAWRLFVRDTRARFRQSLLGYLWLLLSPITSMLMFAFLRAQNILNVGETDIPYPAFVLVGTVLWEAFSAALWAPMRALGGAGAMITKLNFPREALLLTGLYHIVFDLLIKLTILVPVFLWYRLPVAPTILLAPLGILSILVFGFMLGLLLAPLGTLYHDVGRVLGAAMGAWFLVTPVIYPPPTAWPGVLVNQLNPVSPLLVTARQLLTGGSLTYWAPCLAITTVSLALLFVGWMIFRLSVPHLLARMSA